MWSSGADFFKFVLSPKPMGRGSPLTNLLLLMGTQEREYIGSCEGTGLDMVPLLASFTWLALSHVASSGWKV